MKTFLNLGSDWSDERIRFALQVGVTGVVAMPAAPEPDIGHYDISLLRSLREKVESAGLEFYGIRLLPWRWTYKWMLGLPGRDGQLENLQKTIRNMGEVGMPMLVYNMHALRQYRTSSQAPGRGGTTATAFDYEKVKNLPLMEGGGGTDTSLIPNSHRKPIVDDEMWANLAYFLKAIVPVAEKAEVRLALHPDDPPVPCIGGVARIMRSPDAFRRVLEMAPSDCHGVGFCQGCFGEMGADVPAENRNFGSRGKIFFVDFRNVKGSTRKFSETFPDDGDVDMAESMRAYKDVGFNGPMSPDHILHIDGDTAWGHQYWSYAIGHMKGLAQAIGI